MINWNNIETALFDMDGTIIDLVFDNFFWNEHLPMVVSKHHGISLSDAQEKMNTYSAKVFGTLPWYCVDQWSQELEIDVANMKPTLKHLIAFRPHAEQLLQSIQKRGIKTLLITNAHPDSLNLKMSVCAFENYFDAIISAHDYGYAKENPQFWRDLKNDYPFNPAKTVFFDDNEAVLIQAKAQEIEYLFSIEQPDSSNEAQSDSQFPLVKCFSHFFP